ETPPEPAVRAGLRGSLRFESLVFELLFMCRHIEEGLLRRIEECRVRRRPLSRRVESSPAVQIGRDPTRGAPELSRLSEPSLEAQAWAVLVDPCPQRRPFADERLVRDLDGSVVECHEPRLGEFAEERVELSLGRGVRAKVVHGDAATRLLDAVPELREAQEDVA